MERVVKKCREIWEREVIIPIIRKRSVPYIKVVPPIAYVDLDYFAKILVEELVGHLPPEYLPDIAEYCALVSKGTVKVARFWCFRCGTWQTLALVDIKEILKGYGES